MILRRLRRKNGFAALFVLAVALLLVVVGGALFIAIRRGAIPNPISRLPSILKPGPELPAPQPTPPPASFGGLKIIAPKGGGIYLGAFNDLGLRKKILGDYDGSALSPAEQQQFYSQDLSTMYGKKIAIMRPEPYGCKDRTFALADTGGKIDFFFDRPCHERIATDGYTNIIAFGDDIRCELGFPACGKQFLLNLVNGDYDAQLTKAANEIKQFRHPIFGVYWIEADHTAGFLPSSDAASSDAFRKAMRHIHDLFEGIDPGHITWVAPTASGYVTGDTPGQYRETYPGDAYVDWHGFSFYCTDSKIRGYGNPDSCLKRMRQEVASVGTAQAKSKPVLFEQFGTIRGNPTPNAEIPLQSDAAREQWYKDFFRVIKNYPEVASLWWVQNDYYIWNSALKISEPAVAVIRNAISSDPGYWYSQVQTGPGGSSQTPTPPPSSNIISSGTYSCTTCQKSHQWQINDKHLMYWDGQPYIPVAEFWTNRQYASSQITDFNIWIDIDFSSLGQTEAQYFSQLDQDTTNLTNQGKNYILLIGYPVQPKDASWLFDPAQVSQMTAKWRQYAPNVRKEGLRGIALANEINWAWTWPAGRTADDYGKALGQLAKEVQQIFGEVPVFYKTSGAGGGFNNVLAGGTYANGFGFDLFPQTCSSSGFPPQGQAAMNILSSALKMLTRPLGILWVAEFGKSSGIPEGQGKNDLDYYTTFSSKSELQCNLDHYINAGFTGFIHAVSGNAAPSAITQEDQWYGELKSYIQQQVLQKASGGSSTHTTPPPETAPASNPPPAVKAGAQYNACYTACLKEGNGVSGCANFCAKNSGQETPVRE